MATWDEYKLFGEWVQSLSDRRRAASQTYMAVNTGVATVLAFLVTDADLAGGSLVLASLPLFLAGALACLIWYRVIVHYKKIIGWHYEQLRTMEETLAGSSRIFTKEWEQYYASGPGKRPLSLSRLEIWLPRAFLVLYAVYGLGLVVAVVAGWV
jgi:hypothetical protein